LTGFGIAQTGLSVDLSKDDLSGGFDYRTFVARGKLEGPLAEKLKNDPG
jgi:hypothetical protein